jgi:predicted DNA-binding transcriptional regulator AlpA
VSSHEKRMMDIEELSSYIVMKPQTIRNRLSRKSFPILPKKICGSLRWERKDVDTYLNKLQPLR